MEQEIRRARIAVLEEDGLDQLLEAGEGITRISDDNYKLEVRRINSGIRNYIYRQVKHMLETAPDTDAKIEAIESFSREVSGAVICSINAEMNEEIKQNREDPRNPAQFLRL